MRKTTPLLSHNGTQSAEQLGIATGTIEKQMNRALRRELPSPDIEYLLLLLLAASYQRDPLPLA